MCWVAFKSKKLIQHRRGRSENGVIAKYAGMYWSEWRRDENAANFKNASRWLVWSIVS